jgi:hypothetical protein
MTENLIFEQLNNHKSFYCHFISLGEAYSYLIDSRLNIFKSNDDQWAIVAERLGFNPRAGGIMLEIYYFGNCLINLEEYNGQATNSYTVYPIDWNSMTKTGDTYLNEDAKYWIIRGKQIELSHNKEDYAIAGIDLNEFEPGMINFEEVGRLLITKHGDLLRATDDELYKGIPRELSKILVIDEWYHRDFVELYYEELSDAHIMQTYEINKNLGGTDFLYDFETFKEIVRQDQKSKNEYNKYEWENNRPSAYETWQLIARVIATGDASLYKPTLKPNSHWKNWPNSGSL